VRRTVLPSAEIEARIDALLAVGVDENPRESLSELAKLGARLIIQRAGEDEFDAWLGRARYERRPEAPPGSRNGFRPRRVQTGEGELAVEMPQVREAAEPFVSKLFPRGTKLLRTEPLKAMVKHFIQGWRILHQQAANAASPTPKTIVKPDPCSNRDTGANWGQRQRGVLVSASLVPLSFSGAPRVPRRRARPANGKIEVERMAAPTSAAAVDVRMWPSAVASVVIATTSGSAVAERNASATRSRKPISPR
jgi:hypothetical protein